MKKSRTKLIKEMGYVCAPACLSIKAKYTIFSENDLKGSGLAISIYDRDQLLFVKNIKSRRMFTSRYDYDDCVVSLMRHIFMHDREEFRLKFLEGNIKGLFFYDNLKYVRSKLGPIIFHRKR